MTAPLPYVDHLRGALVQGIARHARRRRRRLTAAAPAAAPLPGLATAVAPRAPDRALAVTRTPDTIELRIADASAGAAAMTRELRAAGIDGEVRVVPVPTALVGKWAAGVELAKQPGPAPAPSGGRGPAETVRLDRISHTPEVVRIPVAQVRESSGRFIFLAGRAARPGEALAVERGRVARGAIVP